MTNSNAKENTSVVKRAFIEIERLENELRSLKTPEPIAIIGMGCKFPGSSNSPEQFWDLLKNGKCAITDIPSERWNLEGFYDADPNAKGKSYVKKGAFLDNIDLFDAAFWGMSPMEAEALDPQQRILLEVTYCALENAKLNINQLEGSKTAVYIGIGSSDYAFINSGDRNKIDAYSLTGTSASTASGRISYVFGFQGPCISIDTACSSSLVSVHYACQSLRNQEADMAIAGGVLLQLAAEATIGLSKLRALAPDGICKTFDANADGYGRGEGCGIVVLKRLSDAIKDNDNILAIIKGSASNQDGKSNGLTAPNGKAQEEVISTALKNAGIKGKEVDYLEAHGTGTSLGDLIEVKALSNVLLKERDNKNKLLLGAVKTNVGHAEHAAGMAGLFKVILSLQHKQIPAHLHLNQQNPHIPWSEFPIEITKALTPWESKGKPRIAGVSSFGFSGTNCHLVLQEAPDNKIKTLNENKKPCLLTISAKSEEAIKEYVDNYVVYFEKNPSLNITDLCFTSNVVNPNFIHRLAIQGKNKEEIYNTLLAKKEGKPNKNYLETKVNTSLKIAFLFTGQGAQYIGMAKELYNANTFFKNQLDECDRLMQLYGNASLLELIYASEALESTLSQTQFTQPALFCVEYSLAKLWEHWGVYPSSVMGHSVGEYVAACIAGVFSLEDGLKLICKRGQLMQQLPNNGAMVNVFLSEKDLQPYILKFNDRINIAAINSNENVTLAGEKDAIQKLTSLLGASNIRCIVLNVSHAFHSYLMDSILDEFESFAQTIQFNLPSIQIISNVNGMIVSADEMSNPKYWRNHIRQAVQFEKSVLNLKKIGINTLIEVGPNATLLGLVKQNIDDKEITLISTLKRGLSDNSQLISSLSQLYVKGVNVVWNNFYENTYNKIQIPGYPFQKKKFWKLVNKSIQPTVSSVNSKFPLVDQRISSPISDIQFTTDFNLEKYPYIRDHVVHGANVVPGALMVEAAIEIGNQIFDNNDFSVQDMLILQAITLQEEENRKVYFVAQALEKDKYQLKLYSQSTDENEKLNWIEHANLKLVKTEKSSVTIFNESEIISKSNGSRSGMEFYGVSDQLGLVYKNKFRIVEQVWWSDQDAIGKMSIPEDESKYNLHPSFLDACFQIPAAYILKHRMAEQINSLYLPIHIQSLTQYKNLKGNVWTYFSLEHFEEDNIIKGDITVKDEDGNLILFMQGFSCKAMKHSALKQHLNKDFMQQSIYNIQWKALATDKDIFKLPLSANDILIFNDSSNWGSQLKSKLENYGKTCYLVNAGKEFKILNSEIVIDPLNLSHYNELFNKLKLSAVGIINLWSFDNSLFETVNGNLHYSVLSCLNLVKTLSQKQIEAYLYMVTKGAFTIEAFDQRPAIQSSLAWGLGNVIPLEHADIHFQMIDISDENYIEEQNQLVNEILNVNQKQHIALRQNTVYNQKIEYRSISNRKSLSIPNSESYYLNITQRGTFDNLALEKCERKNIEDTEVEILVKAAGLNFRDVLNCLGQYPGDPGLPGSECAGIITKVGKLVTELKPGDEVMAFGTMGGFAKYVQAQQKFVIRKPKNFTFHQAATLPIVYLTAWYALKHLAKIKKGDKILIHAATGGVGFAAVKIAKLVGAEIYATAGSEKKRSFLKQLGVKHIMDSRNTDFENYIKKFTNERGVDIILNSLTGKALSGSFNCIAENGYFLEMGKAEIWSPEKIKELNKEFNYLPFDLAEVAQQEPAFIHNMFTELNTEFEAEALAYLPYQSFEIENSREAFRFMSQAKHIGKVIITQKNNDRKINGDSTYIITGGLGGVGLVTTEYLIERGAKHIVLLGRKHPSAEQNMQLDKWRKASINVQTFSVDICDKEGLKKSLDEIQSVMPAVKGIFHAAGVLDDGILEHMDESRFIKVLKPKVQGTWNLHELTENYNLDYFLTYSSIASCMGSPAQGNYASANAFLDALVSFRKFNGMACTTINWGPWSEVGMAHANSDLKKYEQIGLSAIAPAKGKEILDFALKTEQEQIIAVDINWDKYKKILPLGQQWIVPANSNLAKAAKDQERTYDIIPKLNSAGNEEKKKLILSFLQSESARILGYDESHKIDTEIPFNELGFDSLSAVELKNVLSKAFDIKLQPTVVFQYPTIIALSEFIYKNFENKEIENTPENKPEVEEMVSQLSEADVNLLLKEFETN